ncbi:hypothetical protein SEVIR_7G283201v4 [Setaria viridis]
MSIAGPSTPTQSRRPCHGCRPSHKPGTRAHRQSVYHSLFSSFASPSPGPPPPRRLGFPRHRSARILGGCVLSADPNLPPSMITPVCIYRPRNIHGEPAGWCVGSSRFFLAVACCSWLDLPHDHRLPVRSCDPNGRTVVAQARVGMRDLFWRGLVAKCCIFFSFSVVCQTVLGWREICRW